MMYCILLIFIHLPTQESEKLARDEFLLELEKLKGGIQKILVQLRGEVI